jgi:TRAP-type C4-dicarboxylate transport system permease small subunit
MVFFIAMAGSALAAQKMRMIGIDAITRSLAPRARAIARTVSTALVVLVCYFVGRAGMTIAENVTAQDQFINDRYAYLALPIGAALIALHYMIHSAVDLIYLARGDQPPDPGEGQRTH